MVVCSVAPFIIDFHWYYWIHIVHLNLQCIPNVNLQCQSTISIFNVNPQSQSPMSTRNLIVQCQTTMIISNVAA